MPSPIFVINTYKTLENGFTTTRVKNKYYCFRDEVIF